MQYKAKRNPFNGQLQLVPTNIVLAFKTGVDEQTDLPLSGNAIGDARLANDTGHLYVWSIESSSGLLSDWIDAGDIVDLNWSAISGKPSSAVADIDNAVLLRHAPNSDDQIADTVPTEDSGISVQDALNTLEGLSHIQDTDKYLTTQITNILYVDNKRIDIYTENGSFTKPFKTIQAAHDAIVGNTPTNQFEIRIVMGADYSEVLTLSKNGVILTGIGMGAGSYSTALTGAITITASNVSFQSLRIKSAVTLSLSSHFCINVRGCIVSTGEWNFTATAPVGDEWLQIFDTMFSSKLNTTNLGGMVCFVGGVLQIGGLNVSGALGWLQMNGVAFNSVIVDIESATQAYIGGCMTDDYSTINVKAGATLYADATVAPFVVNAGTLILTTKGGNVLNDSSVTGTTVKDALEHLDTNKSEQLVSINSQLDDYTLALTDINKLVDMNKATPVTLTIPKNSVVSFAIGTTIALQQKGAGKVTIAPVDGDVTINSQSGFVATTGQYAMASLLKVDTNTWVICGSLGA